MSIETDKILESVESVPSLPISVSRILEITQDPYASPNDLNKLISLDPILTGKVLKLVNSAYFSLSTKVNSIVKAIILLGVNTIRNLALTTAVVPFVEVQSKSNWVLNVEGYWKHSIAVGVTSKLIGKKLGVPKELLEEHFICGLLHDIGKVVLSHALGRKYQAVIVKSSDEECELIEAENELLDINHVEIGRQLAEKWALSSSVVECISYHHNPKECNGEKRTIVYSVAIANSFANAHKIGFSGNQAPPSIDKDLLDYLKLTVEELEGWQETINQEIKKASVFMKIT